MTTNPTENKCRVIMLFDHSFEGMSYLLPFAFLSWPSFCSQACFQDSVEKCISVFLFCRRLPYWISIIQYILEMGNDNRIDRSWQQNCIFFPNHFLFCEKQIWTCNFLGIFWHFKAKAHTFWVTETDMER